MSRQTPVIFSKSLYSTLTPLSNRLQPDPAPITRSNKYRYSSLSRNQNSEQVHISSALSKEYRSQLKTALPQIKQDKIQLLQQWLNDALQGDIPEDGRCRQPLKILKSYELDKASLRNQNISNDQINKLYNGLFVYSNGIKNAFEEMFAMTSGMQSQNNRFEKIYWQVFIKLLQSTIPVKTCFQITEQTYIRELADMKKKIALKDRAFDGERENYETTIRKLRKDIDQANHKFKSFQNDYNIMKATLQMTELTFNDEVSLRLKFEEKINQVYSSYEQLQEKYEKLRVELNDKKQSLIEVIDDKKQLNDRMNEQIIRNNDLTERLQRLQNNLRDMQEQLQVKNQQILDIQLENCSVQQQKAKEEFALQQLLVTIRLLKKNQAQHNSKIDQMQNLVKEHESTIAQLKQDLTATRDKNDDLYIRYHEAQIRMLPIQQDNIRQSTQIVEMKSQLAATNLQKQQLQLYKKQVDQMCRSLETDLQNNRKDLASKEQLLSKYAHNLSEMKEVKDRIQRYNSQLKFQMQNQRLDYNQKIQRLAEATIKMSEMKAETDKLKQKVKILQNQLANQQETRDIKDLQTRRTNDTHKQQLSQKQRLIKLYQTDLQTAKNQMREIQQASHRKDSQKLKKLQQITYLRKINTVLEQDLKSKKQAIVTMEHEIQVQANQIHALKTELSGRQFASEKKNHDLDSEKKNLRAIIAQQHSRIQQRTDYAHPMIVEDLTHQLSRLNHKIKLIQEKNKYATENFDEVAQQLQSAKRQIEAQNDQINLMTNSKEELLRQLTKVRELINTKTKQYQNKLQEKQQHIDTLKTEQKERMDKFSIDIEKYQSECKTAHATIAILQTQISSIRQMQKLKSIQTQKNNIAIQTQEISSFPNINPQAAISCNGGDTPNSISSSIMKRSIRPAQQTSLQKSKRTVQKPCQNAAYQKLQEKSFSLSLESPTPPIEQKQRQHNIISPEYKRQQRQQKKIEGRQFKKALRLTFMRR